MRNTLDLNRIDKLALKAIEAFHAETVKEVQEAAATNKFLIVGMAQNPVVKKARAALDSAGIPFKYLEYGSYFSKWHERLAIKLWSGWPTFPQVFIEETLIGGYDDLAVWLKAHKR